jgi:molybdopterin converting factor small subunit
MLRISLFAGMAEAAGCRSVDVEWQGGTVGSLRAAVAKACPAAAPLIAVSAFAVGGRYCGDADPVALDAEVAIIPPVSGG